MRFPLKMVGIAGSPGFASHSPIALTPISDLLQAGTEFDAIDIANLPDYNEDIGRDTLPRTVASTCTHVQTTDAIVIATPEFNHGLPGVLKDIFDWLSRSAFSSDMLNKLVFFVTLSPGGLGGVRAQNQLRETLASTPCRLVPQPKVEIIEVRQKVEDGKLIDVATLNFIPKTLPPFFSAVAPLAVAHAEVP